ncbi:hypothetical protein GIB67_023337, partial [Kingdonia uniflora]
KSYLFSSSLFIAEEFLEEIYRMPHLFISSSSFKRLFSSTKEYISSSFPAHGTNKETKLILPITDQSQKPTWKCFSYEEIFKATNGFNKDNLVGRGGYAEVYRGVLKDGQVIAVKRLTRSSTDERKEKEFLTELGTMGHVHHPNVSSLMGCCLDNGLYLIFEFSLHGSVSSVLHDERLSPVSWKVRYKIAVGSARGLHYLHKGCQRRIIHRDIKASNILLTADYEPQISDFGLAKWLPSQWSHHSVLPIEGTHGYLAPEYFMHGIVDEKTDVFAFGVFLLEVITGRKPINGKTTFERRKLDLLVDPRLLGDYDTTQLKRLAITASLCIRTSATWRPSMSEVLEVMEDGEMVKDIWKLSEEEEEEEEFWGFEDLECECEIDSSFSSSPINSITGRSF